VLVVVQAHRLFVYVWFQRVIVVREWWKLEGHGSSPLVSCLQKKYTPKSPFINFLYATPQKAHLAPGDALVPCTDGVPEARSPNGIFFGEEQIERSLRSSVGLNASGPSPAAYRVLFLCFKRTAPATPGGYCRITTARLRDRLACVTHAGLYGG
jgi:hypothetical protein